MINSPVWMVSLNNITLRFNELQLVEDRPVKAVSVTKCAQSVLMHLTTRTPLSTSILARLAVQAAKARLTTLRQTPARKATGETIAHLVRKLSDAPTNR